MKRSDVTMFLTILTALSGMLLLIFPDMWSPLALFLAFCIAAEIWLISKRG